MNRRAIFVSIAFAVFLQCGSKGNAGLKTLPLCHRMNISPTIRWMGMKFCADTHGAQRMNVVPSSGQNY